jgi:hypothetical protein
LRYIAVLFAYEDDRGAPEGLQATPALHGEIDSFAESQHGKMLQMN